MPGIPTFPLFAAGIDWLEGLLPLLFLVFWIVSQVVGVLRKAFGGGAAARPGPRPPRPRPEPLGGEVRGELERQIEEFLGRSRSGEQPRPVAARPDRPKPKSPAPGKEPAQRPPSGPAVPRVPRAAERPLGSLAAGGTDVARHVHDAFAHEIGHLTSPLVGGEPVQAGPTAAARSPAAELVAAIRSPATIRQLMLLREVLDRPVERW